MDLQFVKMPLVGEIKAQRGIGEFVFAGAYTITAILLESPPIDVQPGKETEIKVSISALPPNADIERVVATLLVGDASGTPSKATTGIEVIKNGNANNEASGNFEVSVDQPMRPRNVQLKLAGGDTFWSMGGVLTEASYDLPDFAAALNAYLDAANATAPLIELPFVLTSDTPGKVGLNIKTLEYAQVKTQAWPNDLDGTTRVDRNLDLSFGTIERLALDPLTSEGNRTVALRSLTIDVGGQLGPERLLGSVEAHDGEQFATISSDYALAQKFSINGTLIKGTCSCAGITCSLTADANAELYVELQTDVNGAPATDAPLAQANLAFMPPDARTLVPPWTFAPFAAHAELKTDTPYWIVIKGVRGAARLGLQPAPNGDTSSVPVHRSGLAINRGGQTWKALARSGPALAALLGIVYLPGPDDQTAAVELIVSGAPEANVLPPTRIDPAQQATTVTLVGANGTPINWNTAVLEIRSHAQGTLSIANVIQTYKVT